ncbi:MAG: lamin tail domain-containing protein, partial [Patescibacteria group bacterium]
SQYDYSDDIIISEILPNPAGSDNDNEFIELFNKGDRDVSLEGWILSDSTIKKYAIKNGIAASLAPLAPRNDIIIKPQDYFIIYRKDSGIALNNTSDAVELYQPLRDEPLQVVKYEKAKEEWSYCAVNATSTKLEYEWSEIVTPGEENNIKTVNHPPAVDFSYSGELQIGQVIFFDSSDTVDEDEDKLSYLWDFGTGRAGATTTEPNPIFIYSEPGAKQVILIVSDGKNEVEKEKIVTLTSASSSQGNKGQGAGANGKDEDYKIVISEFMPNPEGVDSDGEWIKIQNSGSQSVNLAGWQLDDGEGGSSPYKINEDIFLDPNNFFVFSREDTKLALNNTVDSVRLFNNFGELVDSADYEKTKEGISFVRQNGQWVYAGSETSGSASVSASSPAVKTSSSSSAKSTKITYAGATTLEKIREFDLGDKVSVTGTVAVLPGVFSTQYFYIVGSPGIQVYSYNKYFPDLTVGDVISVSGELSESYGNLRLKTSAPEDIKITATSTPPEPAITECDKINERLEAQLVRVKGEVVEKSGSTVWLDDGNDEIEVYIKTNTGINKNSIKEGATITVIGIVYQNNETYRVMPRSSDDIIIEGVNREGEVLGEVSVSDEWTLAQNNKKLKLMQYLLIIASGLILVLGGVVWKKKK